MASVEVYGRCIMQQCHVRCLAQKKPFSWRDLTHLCLNYNNGDNAGNHMLLHMFVFKPLICGGQINLVQHIVSWLLMPLLLASPGRHDIDNTCCIRLSKSDPLLLSIYDNTFHTTYWVFIELWLSFLYVLLKTINYEKKKEIISTSFFMDLWVQHVNSHAAVMFNQHNLKFHLCRIARMLVVYEALIGNNINLHWSVGPWENWPNS